MIISVASGKGGTGKTTVAVNLALSLVDSNEVQFIDADTEEPNAHIFLDPTFTESREVSILVPEVDEEKCTFCGRCAEVCAFNAIAVTKQHVLVFPEICHGCGGCALLCPEKAITEVPRALGILEKGTAHQMDFVHGRLNVGEAISPPIIKAVKSEIEPDKIVILDSAPGTSCPMVEAIKGSDFCLLVTEPTPFGHNDLVLAVEVTRKLGIPAGVVINRCDVGDKAVEEYCEAEGLPILMRIPFDRQVAVAYAAGVPASLFLPGWKERFSSLARELFDTIGIETGKKVGS